MNYTKKVFKGVGIILLMNVIAYIIAYVTRIVLARKLGPEEYGLFYAVFTFIIFFLFFRDLGLNQAMIKYIAEFRALRKEGEIKTIIMVALAAQIASSLIFALLFFVCASFLGQYYFKDPAAVPLLKLMVFYTLGSIVFTLLKGFFVGFQRFNAYAWIDVIKNGLILGLILLFLQYQFGARAPAWAYVLAGPLLLILYILPLKKTYAFAKHRIGNVAGTAKMLFAFGLPVLMTDVGDKIISYIDTLMLTHLRSLAEVGIYNVALPSAMTFLFPGMALSSIVFPLVAELWAKKDMKRLVVGIELVQKYTFMLVAPIILAFLVYGGIFITVTFGAKFGAATAPFQILLLGVLFFIVTGVNHSIISGIGYPKTVTKIIVCAALANAGVNAVLIPYLGINGAALATTASYTLAWFISTIKVKEYVGIKLPVTTWIKTAVAAAIFMGGMYGIRSLLETGYMQITIALTGSIILYVLSLIAMGAVDKKEINFYMQLLKK